MLRTPTLLLLTATVLGATAMRAPASRARAIARVQLTAAQRYPDRPRGTVLVFAEGPARVATGDGEPRLLRDTLRLSLPATVTVDLTDGALHVVRHDSRRDVRVAATVTGAPALSYGAVAGHVVLARGGTGVRTGR